MDRKDSGILAGILGASCCVLPLILVAGWLGGSLLTIFLVKYKAYLMTFAVAALAISWIRYNREARECRARFCAITGGRFRKWLLGANTAVVVFFVLITYTPAGALVGIDFQSGESPSIAAGLQGRSGVIPPLDPQFGVQAKPVKDTAGVTRLERLTLRVEGMS